MIKEQKLKYISDFKDILKKISEEGKFIDQPHDIEINFYGDKELLINLENKENLSKNDENSKYLVGKYNDIYIGCLSINDLSSREKFGLNRYFKDIFYIGQWKENQKEGILFLKLKENIFYIGNFSKNQFNGFGMLLYKDLGYLYLGKFNNGQMDKGVYYNYEKSVFYYGKFKNGKKNDISCSFFDYNNKHFFLGEVKDDNFIKGYFSFCEISEKSEDLSFDCDKIIFYDKTDSNNPKYESFLSFDINFYDKIREIILNIFQINIQLKDFKVNYIEYFESLENILYNNLYTEYIEKYNPEEELNIENKFIQNYNIYQEIFKSVKEAMEIYLEKNEDLIKGEPKLDNKLKSLIKK